MTCEAHRDSPRSSKKRGRRCHKCKLEDGFEGNAQSFRILTALAETGHTEDEGEPPRGLDLTVHSLRAATKYPWLRGDNPSKPKKWGAYDIDAPIFQRVASETQALAFEAQVMDWSDDIAYAVHDIEDFYRIGYIPLDQYMAAGVMAPRDDAAGADQGADEYEVREALEDFLKYVQTHHGDVTQAARHGLLAASMQFPARRFTGTSADLKALGTMRGYFLDHFIGSTRTDGAGNLVRDEIADEVNGVLKQLIWYHVIDEPRLTNIQTGQRRILREIFEEFEEATVQAAGDWQRDRPMTLDMRRLPHALQRCLTIALRQEGDYNASQRAYRALLDYISGMSEPEAYRTHAVLKGLEPDGRLLG